MLDAFAEKPPEEKNNDDPSGLVNYVMDLVTRWRKYRDGSYQEKWSKYEAIYNGDWNDRLRTKTAERSKIITPATTNAVDQSVSEIIEAIFGRGKWVDLDSDPNDDQQVLQEDEQLRDTLLSDLHKDGIKTAVIQTVFNGAKFGTGIIKRIVDTKIENGQERDFVSWETVPPLNFVIDSAAVTVESAHGVAHEMLKPKHEVLRLQKSGEYRGDDIGSASGFGSATVLSGPNGQSYEKDPLDGVYITEYHGKVPRAMLDKATAKPSEEDPLQAIAQDDGNDEETDEVDTTDLVEAIVTVANGSTLLKAVLNPIIDGDRGFIAYQHYCVPNRFWGMGVVEKAYNSQLALDAEIRARMDTLALVTYPCITADATRLPRNLDLTVVPGKVFRTNGRGSEIIEALKWGNLDPVTFQHSQDLERYVQLATGATDPATPVNQGKGQATASGNSMQFGSYIKRAKLPMQNIDENLLDPLVRKSLKAYMTIAPDRYPRMLDFNVNSTLSIMAREFEQMQLTNLMALLPQGSPEYSIVLTAIIENYSGPSKDKLIAAIQQTQQPDPQKKAMDQQMQQLQMAGAHLTVQKLQAEIAEIQARTHLTNAKVPEQIAKPHQKNTELHIQAMEAHTNAEEVQVQQRVDAHKTETAHTGKLMDNLTKAHATHVKAHVDRLKAMKQAQKGQPAK